MRRRRSPRRHDRVHTSAPAWIQPGGERPLKRYVALPAAARTGLLTALLVFGRPAYAASSGVVGAAAGAGPGVNDPLGSAARTEDAAGVVGGARIRQRRLLGVESGSGSGDGGGGENKPMATETADAG